MREGRQEHKEYRRIHKIDFLIHPGFLQSNATPEAEPEASASVAALYEAYLEQAKMLPENEVLCVFPAEPYARMRTDATKQHPDDEYNYVSLIRDLKTILGDRVVVLSDDYKIAANDAEWLPQHMAYKALGRIRRLLRARGMDFDEHTVANAYGEFLLSCVTIAARHIHETGYFASPVAIRALLTEYITDWAELQDDARSGAATEEQASARIRYDFED